MMSASDGSKGIEQTPQLLKQLIQKCFEAKEKAYSPYSKFRVGAAILTENGEFITGITDIILNCTIVQCSITALSIFENNAA